MYFASLVVSLTSILGAYYLNLLDTQPSTCTWSSFADAEKPELVLMAKETAKLKILTQNMFMRPPLIKNNKSDWKDARLDYLIENILPNYDVVCLQEMFEYASSRRSRLLSAAGKLGMKYYVVSPRQYLWNVAIDGGLAILSKYPIVDSEILEYRRGMGPDWIPKKGVIYAKIAINTPDNNKIEDAATHVHMFTTHTQASYGEVFISQPDVKRRLGQLHEFHNFLEDVLPKHRSPGEPVVLTGDFNVDSRNHVLSDPEKVKYERDVEDGKTTSDEGTAMMDILRGHGIDPSLLGPGNKDTFKGKQIIELSDTLYERLGYHPVTFGNTIVNEGDIVLPRETVLTTKGDNNVMHSIDYVIWHNPDSDKQKNGVVSNITDVYVTPNFTPDAGSFTQISDHYGVAAELSFGYKH